MFYISAATLGAISLISLVTLKSSPRDVGLPEPNASAASVYGETGNEPVPPSFAKLIGPLLASPANRFVAAYWGVAHRQTEVRMFRYGWK